MNSLDPLLNSITYNRGKNNWVIFAIFGLIYIFAIFLYFNNDVCDVKDENCMAKKKQLINIITLGSIILIIGLIIYIFKKKN